jgi:hypothetical protein
VSGLKKIDHMVLACERCGKKGTLDEQPYWGKRLRLRCPYCSGEFIHSVPMNGNGHMAEGSTTVFAGVGGDMTISDPSSRLEPTPSVTQVPEAREGDDVLIQEAKRIARLIISEIKLYNQEKIANAKSKREVLELLKNDLIKGKQHYNTRIASKLPMGPDYFMESVKDILLTGKN